MADLVIAAAKDLGPLSVNVVAVGGEWAAKSPILLSSACREATIHDLAPGEYAVIGTRPTGETLTERVALGKKHARVQFETKGRSPHEFLAQEALRGLVPSLPQELPREPGATIKNVPSSGKERLLGAAGSAGRALDALLKRSPELNQNTGDRYVYEPPWLELGRSQRGNAQIKTYSLRQWELVDGHWTIVQGRTTYEYQLRSDYLKLFIKLSSGVEARAFALCDETGFGPIVVSPLFRRGLDITFLADGLIATDAAERVSNPSALRVPVAVAMPRDSGLADLLTGLTAASLPCAEQLWVQDAKQRSGSVDHALDFLLHKYNDPAAAVLGAHFLARFSPTSAPVRWLENLSRLLPNIADAPTLLAWRLIADGTTEDRKALRRSVRDSLQEAERRPCCLFARTRALLTQALRPYGTKPRVRSVERSKATRRAPPGDFLNVAAEAGGLESFWGSNPSSPGRSERRPSQEWQGLVVHFDGGLFKP
jgi:hypothetical protein